MPFQPLWRLLFTLYFGFLSWQLLTPVTIVNPGSWDKLIHFSGFFVLAALACLAWRKMSTSWCLLILFGYAAVTEILQYFIPGRNFSVIDWIADSLGVLAAIALSLYLSERIPFLNTKTP